MSSFKYLVIAGLTAAVVQPVFADDGLSQVFSTCMDQSDGSTPSMIECMGAETERQDVRLNKAGQSRYLSFDS